MDGALSFKDHINGITNVAFFRFPKLEAYFPSLTQRNSWMDLSRASWTIAILCLWIFLTKKTIEYNLSRTQLHEYRPGQKKKNQTT